MTLLALGMTGTSTSLHLNVVESSKFGNNLSSQPIVESPPSESKEPDIIAPPEHFAVVERGLYRSGIPSAESLPFIRSLGLKQMIVLSAERPVRSITNFCDNHNIKISHTGLYGWTPNSSWKPIAEEVVKESLQIILHCNNHPILVCDIGGVHIVGMVIGCLRRLQNWNLNSVVNEYRSFAGPKTRYNNEQFMELFDIDLVTIPQKSPPWYAEQLSMDEKEQAEYERLVETKLVDSSGTLRDSEGVPQYEVYYYSSAGPLNSQIGGIKPRIQTLGASLS